MSTKSPNRIPSPPRSGNVVRPVHINSKGCPAKSANTCRHVGTYFVVGSSNCLRVRSINGHDSPPSREAISFIKETRCDGDWDIANRINGHGSFSNLVSLNAVMPRLIDAISGYAPILISVPEESIWYPRPNSDGRLGVWGVCGRLSRLTSAAKGLNGTPKMQVCPKLARNVYRLITTRRLSY